MEDLFSGLEQGLLGITPRNLGSKVHLNRLLEGNPVPTLWTTNDIGDCDAAFLRRMTFTMELRSTPSHVRQRIWHKLAEKHHIELDQHQCRQLAAEMDGTPSLINTVFETVNMAKGGPEDIKLAANAIFGAVHKRSAALDVMPNVKFDPTLSNADHDLMFLTNRMVEIGSTALGGLLLSGMPGTGKSAFARHLADALELPILERHASDLLDRYVGGSERKIADAFAEARETNAFLIFDEVDSVLSARNGTSQHWEVTQVNEMLASMDKHPLPFACTTNFASHLDQATARRFLLHIEFRPLSSRQREECFRRFFKIEPPSGLIDLDQLTPGDFAVVIKRANLLGILSQDGLLNELDKLHRTKPTAKNVVGFTQNRTVSSIIKCTTNALPASDATA